MIPTEIVLAVITLLSLIGNIVYTRSRTRGTVDTIKAQEESDRQRREDEARQRTVDALVSMNETLQATVKQNGALVETLQRQQDLSERTITAQSKTTTEVHDIAETLDMATGVLSGLDRSVEAYQKKGITAIETIQTVPTLIDGVKSDIADAKKVIDELPTSLRAELKPVTDKLASLDKHVEDMAADLKREIGQIRSDVMTLVKAALAPVVIPPPPEPPRMTVIPVVPPSAVPGATP